VVRWDSSLRLRANFANFLESGVEISFFFSRTYLGRKNRQRDKSRSQQRSVWGHLEFGIGAGSLECLLQKPPRAFLYKSAHRTLFNKPHLLSPSANVKNGSADTTEHRIWMYMSITLHGKNEKRLFPHHLRGLWGLEKNISSGPLPRTWPY